MLKVSIIIPIYNAEKYIERCIESCLAQTFENIEIIAINDGSSDNTKNILSKYNENPKVCIYNNKNHGISYTRNFGITKSTGDFIMFVDSDDYLESQMIELLYNKAIKNDLDVVVCDYFEIVAKKRKKIKIVQFDNCSLLDNLNLVFEINASPWNKLFKSELIKKCNLRFPCNLKYEDLGYIPILLLNSKRIGKVNQCLYNYIIRSNSETTTVDNKVFDIFVILNILYDNYKKYGIHNSSEVEYLFIKKLSIYNLQQKYNKDNKNAIAFINKSFQYLYNKYPNWQKNKYLKQENFCKRIIKKHRFMIKLYVKLGGRK